LAVDAARRRAEVDSVAYQAAVTHRQAVLRKFEEARIARRALERVRERRRDDWRLDASRMEQREVDEVALRRTRAGGHQ